MILSVFVLFFDPQFVIYFVYSVFMHFLLFALAIEV